MSTNFLKIFLKNINHRVLQYVKAAEDFFGNQRDCCNKIHMLVRQKCKKEAPCFFCKESLKAKYSFLRITPSLFLHRTAFSKRSPKSPCVFLPQQPSLPLPPLMPQQRNPQGHHDHGGQKQGKAHRAEAGERHAQTEANGAHAPVLVIFEARAVTVLFAI